MQNYQEIHSKIQDRFLEMKKEKGNFLPRLNLSWSNWGFGLEPLESSLKRLAANGLQFIELHGNHYGNDLGYDAAEVKRLLDRYGMEVSGICGMFSVENDLSSNSPLARQAALDYVRRELAFAKEVGGHYLLVVPGAVGRSKAYDEGEFYRSSQMLRTLGNDFAEAGICAAIEPIRRDEVSLVHTVSDAKDYIAAVGHPAIGHINGDVFHMQAEEANIAEAILEADEQLVNLHMADSNRRALGNGGLDVDAIIMALYMIGYNRPGCFVSPEPLGPGSDPYQAMNRIPDTAALDELVRQTVSYFREREEVLLSL